jgi:hypothetical protein
VRRLPAAALLGAAALSTVPLIAAAPPAGAQPAVSLAPPPYIDHVAWAKWGDLNSLRVYPTPAGRDVSGRPGTAPQADEAWSEVLAQAPDAAQPGMKDQFVCHWQFAEIAEPGKTSWNLEPWRPEVSPQDMIAAGCNPGGTEEPF